ncbi:MAG: DNA polymerase III subunit delta' [Actinobacteria bacterium]|nr:DNA polymerase III subunit delta' [Actinomycetota bacterium]
MEGITCSGWGEIYGQEKAVSLLRDGLRRGDLPHALLFTGPRGVGKFSAALLFAAAVLCPRGEPDGCPSCRKVAAGVHPDLHVLEPEGLSVKVEQVRGLDAELSAKALESSCKVAIIDEADAMTREAANAFLKTLEEPAPGTYVVLVCESKENLLPTVLSRCREVRFTSLGRRDLERFLVEREGLPEEEAQGMARRSGGIFGRALLWARRPELAAHWRRGVELAASLRRLSLLEALDAVEDCRATWQKMEIGGGEEELEKYLRALDRKAGEQLRKRWEGKRAQETRRARRRAAHDLLDGMASFYRDIMLLNLVEEEGEEIEDTALFNPERRKELEREALHVGAERARMCLEILHEAGKALEANVDEKLLLHGLILRLRGAT